MKKRKKKDGGCLRCGRRLKEPHPSGMGPTCRKKGYPGSAGQVAEGQLELPQAEEAVTA